MANKRSIYSKCCWVDGKLQPATVCTENNIITEIHFSKIDGVEDAGNDIVMPGVIDAHVHINEPGRTDWEGFDTATLAAAAGGITTVVDMPLNASPVTTTVHAFNEKLDFSGVVLTKLDGDTRGGAALSIKYTVNKPIKFASSGEKMDTLDVFYPERMAQRILGMGDIVSLVEKAQEQFDEAEAKKLEKKIRKNQFDFEDFKTQLQQIKKMGNLKDLMGMIPGVGKQIKDVDINDDSFKGIEAMINSMTLEERRNPDIINPNRKLRIAKGAGKDIAELNAFLKQFEQMKGMMKMMNKMPMGKMPGLGKR